MAQYIWPVPKGIEVRQEFGADPESEYNPPGGHTGMDFGTEVGTPIFAPAAGVIEYAQAFTTDNGSDNPYWITNGGGITVVLGCDGDASPSFVFSHLSSTDKNPGERVAQGDVIGYSGNTGKWTTGPHCHFEAIPPGFNLNSPTYGRVDPASYCTGYKPATALGSKPTPIQEDDMPLTNADVAKILDFPIARRGGRGGSTTLRSSLAFLDANLDSIPGNVWSEPVTRGGKKIPALQDLASGRTAAELSAAKIVGLEAVVKQLSEKQGVPIDYAQVTEAVKAGLVEGIVTVDVSFKGASE